MAERVSGREREREREGGGNVASFSKGGCFS